jgi:N-acetylglucosamine malate deacetylase 1
MRAYFAKLYRVLWPWLYSKQQYKLFLTSTMVGVDARVRKVAALTGVLSEVVKTIPIQAPFGESLLVVAPHQDDEIIGCGGALALQLASGKRAHTVIVQDGGDEHDAVGMTREQLRDLRNNESRRAAEVLGMEPVVFLNHQDLTKESGAAAEALYQLLQKHRVDVVFTPFLLDGNPDHQKTNRILAQALSRVDWNVRVLGYEVWGLCIPNVAVVIDTVIEQKQEMLRRFVFANAAVDYTNTTTGLNMYRSRLLAGQNCRYVECFFETPRQDFIDLVAAVNKP